MYYVLVLLILFLYIKCQAKPQEFREKYDNRYSLIICIVLILMAALRGDDVGADTPGYRLHYEELSLYPTLESLIDRYTIYYIVYYGLSKLFSMAHMPVQVWFGFIEAFYLFSLMKLINRYSRDKIFSLLIFTTIGLWSFSMAGEKQTLSMTFMMLAYMSFIDRKYWISIALVFATYYTHQSALIFLTAFPLYFIRKTKGMLLLVVVFCLLIYFYSMSFMTAMVDVLGNQKWEAYLVDNSGYTYVTFIFYAVITIISYYCSRNYFEADAESARLSLGISSIGCGLQLLAGVSPSLFRLAFLYTPFMMILLPNTVYYIDNSKSKQLVRLILMFSVIFYFLYSGRRWPYSFYFQHLM